jgi:hypothetical protein
MDAPTAYDVAHLASSAVLSTMKPLNGSQTGSDKSGPGEWFDKDVESDPGYHYMRAMRHLTSAWLNDDPNESRMDHLFRALTRIAFCIAIETAQEARKEA